MPNAHVCWAFCSLWLVEYRLPRQIRQIFRTEGDLILLKRLFSVAMLAAVLCTSLFIQSVNAQSSDTAAARARAKVEQLGVGSKVEVKFRDNTKLKGHIDAASTDSFVVVDKTGARRDVAYVDVAEVKKPSGGLSTKSWIILGSVAAGALITWVIVKPVLCDGGAQSRGPC